MDVLDDPQTGPVRVDDVLVGTRFLVYPQAPFVPGYNRPEVVWLSPPLGTIMAGPSDDRFYVIEPIEPKKPYDYPDLPPYSGAIYPLVEPGPDGHFDYLRPGSDAFMCAHAYACARRVLDICESYVGRRIPWHFAPEMERLEIVPLICDWKNSQSGFGFLELGESDADDPTSRYALNFDAIAHEMGHLVLFGELGVPQQLSRDFLAYHEVVADFISLLGLLQFDTAMDRILRRTQGNLLIHNELDRFAEISDEKQLRSFSNSLRLDDVSSEIHDRSKPYTGALFDGLLEVHQAILFDRGLSPIDPRQFSDLRRQLPASTLANSIAVPQPDYEYRHFEVKAALAEARDIMGESLVRSWQLLDPEDVTFDEAAAAFIISMAQGRGRRYANQLEDCFAWREIV